VLRAVDRVTSVSPTLEVVVEPSEKSEELRFIVEGSDNLMAAFVAARIPSIVTYNPAMDGVVVGIYGGHIVSVRRRSAKCERHRPGERPPMNLEPESNRTRSSQPCAEVSDSCKPSVGDRFLPQLAQLGVLGKDPINRG
jgi:hypothetical protein